MFRTPQLSADEARLLTRCALALMQSADGDRDEAARFLECAATAGDKDAQLSWGLWLARMDISGQRNTEITGAATYKNAIRWLSLAGEQGVASAWYAISRIYLKSEFSQRNVAEAQQYLGKAAEAGYRAAQRELGVAYWRTRKDDPCREVSALFWLQKAAAQGCVDTQALLEKIASPARPAAWALAAQRQLKHHMASTPHVLMARIALAAQFGLSLREALMVDLNAVDYGPCLVIDIRARNTRSKRRLILVQTDEERQALNRIARFLGDVDCGPDGPEGNYRQRLYRFKSVIPDWEKLDIAF